MILTGLNWSRGKAPSSSGKFWDALAAMKHAGWITDGFGTGHYGVVEQRSFPTGAVPASDLVPHGDLEAWIAHVNRLKYLNGLIKARSATQANRSEFKRILTNMQDSYKQ